MSILALKSWMQERFPALNFLAAGLTYFAPAVCLRKWNGLPQELSFADLGGWMIIVFHLLLLRVIDEHKDYEWDKHNHPERVLQRGIITLPHLRIVGILAALAIIVLTAWRGLEYPLVWLGFVATYSWVFLMTKEFFVGEEFRQRVFLYSFTHLLISPFLIFWASIWSVGFIPNQGMLLPLMGCSFFAGLSYEIARKTKGREEEVEGEPSYSKNYSWWLTSLLLGACCVGVVVSTLHLLYQLRSDWVVTLEFVFSLGILLFAHSLRLYFRAPTRKTRQYNEGAVTLIGLISFLTAILAGTL